jgi:CRISPR-associated protein Cmr1
MMKSLLYEIRFTNPAFLGDAEQSGRWRTPPFKAQLRQWWRVAHAADHRFAVDLAQMRREEGLLFGNAWLADTFCKSQVRIRLSSWSQGKLGKEKWPGDANVAHPEVNSRDGRPAPVGSLHYLGYGPLTYDRERRAAGLKSNAAIQAGESARIAIAFPSEHEDAALDALLRANAVRIERALHLLHLYGAAGGRSRNGWGSYVLEPIEGTPPWPAAPVASVLQPWRDALALDWAHAIGSDERGPLIWTSGVLPDWRAVMRRLAEVKIALRTQFVFTTGNNAAAPEERHWLSYPVTNHSVRPWGNNARVPNTLRFKLRPTADNQIEGIVFHMPALPPPSFLPNLGTIEGLWKQVHDKLDAMGLARSKA